MAPSTSAWAMLLTGPVGEMERIMAVGTLGVALATTAPICRHCSSEVLAPLVTISVTDVPSTLRKVTDEPNFARKPWCSHHSEEISEGRVTPLTVAGTPAATLSEPSATTRGMTTEVKLASSLIGVTETTRAMRISLFRLLRGASRWVIWSFRITGQSPNQVT